MEELQLPMDQALQTLDADALMRFQRLQTAAVNAVTERFYAVHSAAYERFGETGRDACRSDLAFHLEFLRPVLQFGMLKPMVDYLRWLNQVLAARGIPTQHLPQSLDWLAEFFAEHLPPNEGSVVAAAVHAGQSGLGCPRAYGISHCPVVNDLGATEFDASSPDRQTYPFGVR